MSQGPIIPEKITKPIQVLAAWLAGLFAIDSCFLFAAAQMPPGSVESLALVGAAILNVPVFLGAVFLLQTKFRPELQEDSYYATYLSQKTNQPLPVEKEVVRVDELLKRMELLETRSLELKNAATNETDPLVGLIFGVNKYLSDRDRIKARLAERGLTKCTSFGGPKPPENRVVSVSQYLPDDILHKVLKLAAELGFEYYRRYDNKLEEAEEDVLLGSYGDPEYELLKAKHA